MSKKSVSYLPYLPYLLIGEILGKIFDHKISGKPHTENLKYIVYTLNLAWYF